MLSSLSIAVLSILGYSAYALQAPSPINCITATTSNTGWTKNISLKNNCTNPVDFQNSLLTWQSSNSISGSFWGNYSPLAYPIAPKLTSQKEASSYLVSTALTFTKPTKWNHPNTTLPVGSQIMVSFSANPNITITPNSIHLYTNSPIPPSTTGTLDLTLPAAPAAGIANPQVELKSASIDRIIHPSWGKSTPFSNLPYGNYQILVSPAHSSQGVNYAGSATPNQVELKNSTPETVNISYTKETETGSISITLNQQAFAPKMASPVLGLTDLTTHQKLPNITLHWNGTTNIPNLPANDEYEFSTGKLAGKYNSYNPSFFPKDHITVKSNTTQTVTLQYSATPIKTTPITGMVSGIPSNTALSTNLSFKDNQGNTYLSQNIHNGLEALTNLPQGRMYTVTAPQINSGQSNYTADVSPNHFLLGETSQNLQINYHKNSAFKFVAYWAGWSNKPLTPLATTKVNVIDLAFGNILNSATSPTGYTLDTSVSGYITSVPKPNSQLWPNYVTWSAYAFKHPKTEFFISVGGATFSQTWTHQLTAQSVNAITQTIVNTLKTKFPVYSGNFANPADKIGSVQLAGVDLDAETGGARLTPEIAANVAALTNEIHKLDPTTKITLAAMSVGAGVGDACTVSGSVHCGEDVPVIQQSGNNLAWVNVMAYDAGEDYATSKYQIAMANFAKYISKSKLTLGLDIQAQTKKYTQRYNIQIREFLFIHNFCVQ